MNCKRAGLRARDNYVGVERDQFAGKYPASHQARVIDSVSNTCGVSSKRTNSCHDSITVKKRVMERIGGRIDLQTCAKLLMPRAALKLLASHRTHLSR